MKRLGLCSGLALVLAAPLSLALAGTADGGAGLWRVEAVGQGAKAVYVCADAAFRRALVDGAPEVNGHDCVPLEAAKRSPGHFEIRCRTPDAIAFASSAVRGDPARDFTVNTRISTRPADPTKGEPRGEFVQVRRYRLVGACPAGWGVGDSAAAGDGVVANSRSHVRRVLGTPFSPPRG